MNRTAIIFLLLIFSINGFSQSKLEQSKNELKSDRQSGSGSSGSSSSNSLFSGDDDSFSENIFSDFLENAFGMIGYGAFWLLIGDYSGEEHLSNFYTPYPYCSGYSGNYAPPGYDGNNCIRFTIEDNIYGPLMHRALANRLKGRVNFRHFGFQGDWLQMYEDFSKTALAIVNLGFCYDRLRFQRFNLGWNMGVNFIGSGVNRFGFSTGIAAEAFPFRRFGLYASVGGGRVNKQPVHQFEIRVKQYIGKYYLSAGYESLKIATPHYHYITAGAGVCL